MFRPGGDDGAEGCGWAPFVAGSGRVVATAEKEEGGGCGSASFGIQVA
jgi:hypothetical protein